MKIEILKEIIKKKSSKEEFAVLTNLSNGNSEIFNSEKTLSKDFENYKNEIENHYNLKKNGIIDKTQIFILNYIRPIEVIIVGAVHIAQYLIDLLKNFNFVITIIDPRKYFTTEQRFQNVKVINEWPDKALKKIQTNTNFALITLTHDPKIDDPALNYALKNKFFYIGALGSKKTHDSRRKRLKEAGFSEKEINSIYGPIGIKLGGKSTPEIALSIVAQLVSETNKLLLKSKG
jgi:xanthine dehydrogenase accessory factor